MHTLQISDLTNSSRNNDPNPNRGSKPTPNPSQSVQRMLQIAWTHKLRAVVGPKIKTKTIGEDQDSNFQITKLKKQ